ncbi:PDZ domain-containing protein, partial [Acinetobacter baumannii]
DGAAAAAGFKVGDVVLQIDGKPIESFADMQRIVAMNAGSALTFEVKRDGAVVSLTATPELRERKDPFGNSHLVGVLGV